MKKNDCIEAVHQTWVDVQRRYVILLLRKGFKSDRLFIS